MKIPVSSFRDFLMIKMATHDSGSLSRDFVTNARLAPCESLIQAQNVWKDFVSRYALVSLSYVCNIKLLHGGLIHGGFMRMG